MAPIRLALLGSGIFAREAHWPALQALADRFEVVAVYSRSEANAAALAALIPNPIDTYNDIGPLLARADIDAVDIILPIAVQPAIVEAALRAGKHIISEKPAAPDVATGRGLLQTAAELIKASGRVWMVAENFRYEDAFQLAGQRVRNGDIGRPIQFSWNTYTLLTPHNKYYQTAWRRDNSFPGGMIMDGGVHDMAIMRTIMGEVDSIFAFVTQVREDLPPCDTLSATLRFESGAFGIFTKTLVADAPWESLAQVCGDRGALRVSSSRLELTVAGKTTAHAFAIDNVQAELADFARAIEQGQLPRSTPEEALQDVAIIEAMLESARDGRAVNPARIVSRKS